MLPAGVTVADLQLALDHTTIFLHLCGAVIVGLAGWLAWTFRRLDRGCPQCDHCLARIAREERESRERSERYHKRHGLDLWGDEDDPPEE